MTGRLMDIVEVKKRRLVADQSVPSRVELGRAETIPNIEDVERAPVTRGSTNRPVAGDE